MTHKYRFFFLMIAFFSISSGRILAQLKPSIFVNCATSETRCYRDYLFQKLSNCHFVWDASTANVQVLITEKRNSLGGFRINLEFTGMNQLAEKKDTLYFDLLQSQTEEYIRNAMVTHISKGLSYLFHHTIYENIFKIQTNDSVLEIPSIVPESVDKWKAWNFTTAGN